MEEIKAGDLMIGNRLLYKNKIIEGCAVMA